MGRDRRLFSGTETTPASQGVVWPSLGDDGPLQVVHLPRVLEQPDVA